MVIDQISGTIGESEEALGRFGTVEEMTSEDQASSDQVDYPRPAGPRVKPPVGPGWVHDKKHDGYRMIDHRDGPTLRLYSRNAYDLCDWRRSRLPPS
jgi:hypothetical protein